MSALCLFSVPILFIGICSLAITLWQPVLTQGIRRQGRVIFAQLENRSAEGATDGPENSQTAKNLMRLCLAA